ncbi:TPA: hypothetical protein KD303_004550 [Escherichia coli]|uniref:Uncharacterized protein n=2 Tax=Gammaproteobacteria TaxID=1236 RepID=A0A2R4AHM4_ECOLX|nr:MULTISPECIES: hypothetical protein [Pseudomonadota]AAS78876.1 KorF [Cloning vector pLAFR]ADU90766.1 KorF repressor protein [uncultured bacterium]EEE2967607.1 hypothetical protein [Salmonella enterica subsp. enterica serovar Typhimurium]KJX85290.1 hypothetical protein SY94_6144 [Agrobacterium tumefaciens]NTH75414.1 hypothetical protein [Rhizobium rhizogenes]BAJ06621.1 KorF [Cloning vector pKS800]HDR8934137.1 hypothetical protein [Burkholderia vietnamiensis]
MNPMLFYIAGGVGAALLLVSAIMLFKLREPKKEHRPQRKAAAPTPQPVDNELLRTFRRPSQASQPEPSTTPPARRTAPPSSEQSRGNDGDFVTSALVAGATNSTMLGYLAGGSLTGAMLGDALRPDTPSAAFADPSPCFGSSDTDSGWTDTGSSCDFSSSDTDTNNW